MKLSSLWRDISGGVSISRTGTLSVDAKVLVKSKGYKEQVAAARSIAEKLQLQRKLENARPYFVQIKQNRSKGK